jgi:hypothetical protein
MKTYRSNMGTTRETLRTWLASVSGSLRCFGKAKTVSGKSLCIVRRRLDNHLTVSSREFGMLGFAAFSEFCC